MNILSNQKKGSTCEISSINLPYSKKIRLLGIGVNTGLMVSVLRNRGGDMVLALGNARVSVGRTIANSVKVRAL
ncbi:ferrous iron transport protein A [Candidatus Thiodubiliella endoseptemdiera]|uniref:FeoA family protein n=1 Tax=Candidatus Thiodubiliella endoseptemdiera TaxID=2738886 RepID=UPI0034DF9EC2